MSIIQCMMNVASAFLKWAGGKQSLARLIANAIPAQFGRYVEPFLGGGSVFFAVRPKEAMLSDANSWLIGTYLAVRDDWKAVALYLDSMPNTKDDFLRIRASSPEPLEPAQRAAHLIYLNKTCFRGLFRVNRKGGFNVPYGAYTRRYYDPECLAAVALALKSVSINRCDFEETLSHTQEGDFVYLDPPYVKLGGYSDFNRYTSSQFREHDHRRLAEACRRLSDRGVRWLLSNSDTPLVHELYKGNSFQRISARREINLSSSDRDVDELLVSNYPISVKVPSLFDGVSVEAEPRVYQAASA